MSGMSPWAMLGSARRDRSVVEQKLSRDTVKRVVGFALPHRALIAGFLFFVVIDAALVVVNPLLIKHLLDDGIIGKDTSLVVWLALAMALVSILDAALGVATRLPLLPHRREPDLRPAHAGVRPRAADVAGVLHPHPDRRAGLPAEQRRDRRPARVHLDPVGHGLQLDQRGRRRHHHVRAELAGHPGLPRAVPAAAARLALGRSPDQRPDPSPDGRQRRPRQPDDRAVQRRRRPAAQALRPPRRGGREVRREGRSRPRPRHPHLPGHPGVHGDDDADPGAGHRPRLRHRRHPRDQRRADHRHPDRAGHPAAAAARPAPGPLQRPRRRDDRAGQLRPRLRGARPALDRGREARCRDRAGDGHERRVRPGRLHLPAGRRGLAGQPRDGRPRREPRPRPGAPRRDLQRASPARWSPWSDRPAPARPRSPTWSRGSTTSTAEPSGSAATTSAT